LPEQRFVYAEWKTVGIGIDYHVQIDHHFYSVPHECIRSPSRVQTELDS
jgi:hypothetical protein